MMRGRSTKYVSARRRMEYGARKAALLIRSKGSGSKLIYTLVWPTRWCEGVRNSRAPSDATARSISSSGAPGESGEHKFSSSVLLDTRRPDARLHTHTFDTKCLVARGLAVNSRAALPSTRLEHTHYGVPCTVLLTSVRMPVPPSSFHAGCSSHEYSAAH